MRRFYHVVWIVIVLLYSFNAQSKLTHLTAAVGHYPPYIFCDNKPIRGLAVDLVVASYNQVGINISLKCFPWKRVYNLTKERVFDISFPYLRSDERERDFIYITPMVTIKDVFFHLKSRSFDHLIKKGNALVVKDLANYTIGGALGYRYVGLIYSYDKEYGLDLGKTPEISLRKLIRGRIDLYVDSIIAGYHEVNLLKPHIHKEISHLPIILSEEDLYLIVSNKHSDRNEISKLFIKGFEIIRTNGIEQKLIDKYI